MKILIFGPSGSGKTYMAKALQRQGINAYDDSDIEGLSAWFDRNGNEVVEPKTADEAMANGFAFLWSKRVLGNFINQFSEVYVFGGSGNIFNILDLFDRVYFLKIEPELQKQRLLSALRPTPLMDANEDGIIIWGGWFEEVAKQKNIPFIDASQTPEQIFEMIRT